MQVFVTGATGWIGAAVVDELLAAGHRVVGLTTSVAGAAKLKAKGAEARVGQLTDLSLLREAAAGADGVVHTAFLHGLGNMSLGMRVRLFAGALNGGIMASFGRILMGTESGAIQALGNGLQRSRGALVVASGLVSLPAGRLSLETDSHVPGTLNRSISEQTAFAFIPQGVRAMAVRLAPTVHGAGDHGFVAQIIGAARKNGVSPYIGDGGNRWPAVHRHDAARLFRLALEQGKAGARFHGAAEAGIPFRDIAGLIGRRLGVPTASMPSAAAGKHFGFISPFVAADNPASSEWTKATLGWSPTGPGLLADMDAHYFEAKR